MTLDLADYLGRGVGELLEASVAPVEGFRAA